MNKKDNLLSREELFYLTLGSIIGIGVLQLPYTVVKKVGQDGWIATLLGSVYPLYVIAISNYIIDKFPNDNIFSISKRYFGKIFGNIFSLCYLIEFLALVSIIVTGSTNMLRLYAVSFLPKLNIIIGIMFVTVYTALLGIKNLGRMSKIIFPIILLILIVSIGAFMDGDISNLKPILQSGIVPILKTSVLTITQYSGIEFILLVYPYVKDKKSIAKETFKGVIIVILIYIWVVFITTYYLGPDIVPKTLWPFTLITESINIPVITNARFLFVFLWIIVLLKIISNSYYYFVLGVSNVFKIDEKKLCIALSPLIILLPYLYKNELMRINVGGLILRYSVIFNLIYMSLLAFITYMNKSKSSYINKYK